MNPNQTATTNVARFKTVLCKHYGSGKMCVYGDKCQFAHGPQELKAGVIKIFNYSYLNKEMK